MMIQCVTVKASKMPEEKAAARLKSHLKYLQYRQHNRERVQNTDRHFFNNQSDHIDRCVIHQSMMSGRTGNVYYHCLLFSPTHDEPVNDWRQWTRAILHGLENRFGQILNWYAIEHCNTNQPHVHVIMQGTGKDRETGRTRSVIFHAQDFVYLRERGRVHSEYELQNVLTEMVRQLDQYDYEENSSISP